MEAFGRLRGLTSQKGSSMENLDALLNKIKTEGIAAAQAEADLLLAKAREEAARIVDEAKTAAQALTEEARRDAARLAQGAEATVRQAARDVVIKLGQDVEALLVRTLGGAVDGALGPGRLVEELVSEAVRTYLRTGGTAEIVVPEDLLPALRSLLADRKDVTVVTDPLMGSGFRVRLAGGRVEHDFSGAAVTETLAARLRPQVAALLKD